MKRITNILLLSAGILLSLTGCQKGNEVENTGNLVRFSAKTGNETRTAYSGKITNNFERIDWKAGDQIMVWSDNATVRQGGIPYFSGNSNLAVYTIGSITASNEQSIASIEDPAGNGLQYPKNNSGSTLWGVYPASAVTSSPSDNSVSFTIGAEQALAENDNTATSDSNPYVDFVPDMNQAYMVAYVSGAKAGKTVELPFKPAFTDFEFNITTTLESDLTIKAIELTSTTSAVSGGFTATCTDGTWEYTIAENANLSAKAILPEGGFTINAQNPKLSLNVFALPQDLTNLKVTFYTNEGTKTLKLLDKPENNYAPLTFTGAKKHRLNGIILPSGWIFSYITLDLQVLKWQVETLEGTSEEFPQTTQFSVTGEGVKNGDSDLHLGGTGEDRQKDPYRQQWYFQPRQTVIVTFKVMLPAGGTWEIVPMGGTEANPVAADASLFTVKNVSPSEGTDGSYNLYGPIGTSGSTDVKLEITYNGSDSNQHSFYFRTYAYSGKNKTGEKYNIDSETQLYDLGRGYHTFIVNSPSYNND